MEDMSGFDALEKRPWYIDCMGEFFELYFQVFCSISWKEYANIFALLLTFMVLLTHMNCNVVNWKEPTIGFTHRGVDA